MKRLFRKIFSKDTWENLLIRFLRFFIKRNPVGLVNKSFNQNHPYWSIIISFTLIFSLIMSSVWFGFLRNTQEIEAAWWNDSWNYRRAVPVVNTSTSAQTDVYVAVTIDTSDTTKFKTDCSDLRFTTTNGDLLPYYIVSGCGTGTTVINVSFDNMPAGNQTIYYYYGNPDANYGITDLSGSGAVTNTNMRLSTVDGTAFVDFSEAGILTPYLGSKLIITDSAGKELTGYIKDAGTGETYSAEKFTNPSFESSTGWANETGWSISDGNAIANVAGPNSYPRQAQYFAPTIGELFIISAELATFNSGNFALLINGNYATGVFFDPVSPGTYSGKYTATIVTTQVNGIYAYSSLDATFSEASLKQVLAPSVTGVTIVSTSGGSTYNFASQESGFNYNDSSNYTYEIYPLAFSAEASSYSIGTIAAEEVGNGPIAYWSFDEGYGTTAHDGTGNSNNGTMTNMSSTASSTSGWQTEDRCVSGKCLAFDGSNDYVSLGIVEGYASSNMTVSAWFKTSNLDGWMDIVAGGCGNILLGISSDDSGHVSFGGQCNQPASPIGYVGESVADNNWHLVTGIFDGSNYKLYVDGDLKSTRWGGAFGQGALYIGSVGGSELFDGLIDEVKIYNYARTAAQIKMDYNAGLAGTGGSGSANAGTAVSAGSKSSKWMSDGLVGHWKMDEASWNGTSGEVIDWSGNGNNGTSAGTASTTAGKFGNGGGFDGDSDYISIVDDDSLDFGTGDYTLSSWVKGSSSQEAYSRIFYKGSSYYFNANHTSCVNKFDFEGSTHVCGSTASNDDQWHHVVGVRQGDNAYLYVDGALEGSSTGWSAWDTTSANWLGLSYNAASHHFNGKIDEVKIYNRALSDREVRDLYNYAPGPVGYWNFEEGSGTTANDISGNGNTGTLTNGPTWSQGKIGKALEFDGSDDYVSMGDMKQTGNLTVDFWFNQYSSKIVHVFGSSVNSDADGEFSIIINASGYPSFVQWVDGVGDRPHLSAASSRAIKYGEWNHIAGVYDKSVATIYIYLNGILVGSDSSVGNSTSWYGGIGTGSGESYWFNGVIDEVKIYNYARTQKQIMQDMGGGPSAVSANPVAVTASGKSTVGYWKFDEGYGTTANDSSPQKNNGTLVNGPTWTNNGKFGKALSFDGSDDYVQKTSMSSAEAPGTVSLWFKANSINTDGASTYQRMTMLQYGDTYWGIQILSATNKIQYYYYDGTARSWSSSSAINTGQWYHLVVISTDSGSEMFLNGISQGTSSLTLFNNICGSSCTFTMGGNIAGFPAGDSFDGLIDEVKVYNYALTEDEVKLDYNKGASLKLGGYSQDSNGVASSSASSLSCVPGSDDACSAPIAEWKFEEGSGTTANDTSDNSNTGTLTNGPTWTQGKIGKALNFDGSNDYVTAGNDSSLQITSNSTFSFWIKTTDVTGVPLAKHGDSDGTRSWMFYISSGDINFYTSADGTNQTGSNYSTNINNGQWHYITGVYDGSYQYLYVDGVQRDSDSQNGGIFNTAVNLTIGCLGDLGDFTDGIIDDVKIYNYARTPAQIAWDYNRGKPIAHWKFDECQGGIVHDSSGNNNHGTINVGTGGSQTATGTCSTADTMWGNGATGKRNSSLNFDGTDDWVTAPIVSGLSTVQTISMWFYPKTFSSNMNQYLFDEGSNIYQLQVYDGDDQDGLPTIAFNSLIGSTSFELQTVNMWYHVVGIWNGDGTGSIYINGEFKSLFSGTNPTPSIINIGRYGGGGNLFDGQIDDVQIYNYALTPTQVKAVYNGGAIRFGP